MTYTPRLDHVVVNARDRMDEAVESYRRLGFRLTDRGYHTLGSINHLAVFPNDYLELVGFEEGATQVRTDILRFPVGLNGVVFETEDADALHAELAERAVPVEEPVAFSRPVQVDGMEHTARFRTLRLAPGTVPSGRVYFCQHLTRELVWRREWQRHPNGAVAVTRACIVSNEPTERAALFERMFGPHAVSGPADRKRLAAGDFELEVLTPSALAREFGDAAPDPQARADYMAALTIRTRSLDAALEALRRGGVSVSLDEECLVVPAWEAMNVTLRFIE